MLPRRASPAATFLRQQRSSELSDTLSDPRIELRRRDRRTPRDEPGSRTARLRSSSSRGIDARSEDLDHVSYRADPFTSV